MERLFRHNVCQAPHAEAVVDGSTSVTYADLLAEAEHLKCSLSAEGPLQHEEPVGIILPPGLNQVVAQVAVRLAGATCVPLDCSQPTKRLKSMLQQIHVKKIVLSDNLMDNFSEFCCVSAGELHEDGARVAPSGADNNAIMKLETNHVDEAADDGKVTSTGIVAKNGKKTMDPIQRSHILFTSGSTGTPKPVQINESGIVHLATKTLVTPLLKEDRVAEFNNPGFDLSLFEIWATLLSGAAIVVIPKNVVTDPGRLSAYLLSKRVTAIMIPTALFNIIASVSPHTFQSLRHVLVAGEAASIPAMRSVLESQPPQHLWNAYGPTEGTTMVTMFEVTLEEIERRRISIGFPIGDTKIFLVDENLKPIWESGVRGEICIAGPGKSPGYLGNESENVKRFVTINTTEDSHGGTDNEVQVYRTGDLGEWRAAMPGCLDFFGRQDTQVKHKNFRIEMEEIEHVLQSSDLVEAAVALLNKAEGTGLSSLLTYVIPSSNNEKVSPDAISRFARDNLPTQMVPDRIVLVSGFPLTPNGKVDRRALTGLRSGSLQTSPASENAMPQVAAIDGHIGSIVVQIWKDLLDLTSVRDDDDFFLLGARSMHSAACIAQIRNRLGQLLTIDELHLNSRLADLVQFLEQKKEDRYEIQDNTSIWKKDIDLVDNLVLVPDWESEKEGKIFMTGATGFLGVHMLHKLLQRPKVKRVACLVRPKETKSAAARLQQAMERYDLYTNSLETLEKIVILEGDMTEDNLGLAPERFEWLTDWASVVFHVGAKVNFCESYHEHFRENVLGTRNALNVAVLGRRKGFHYISSLDVWGPTGYLLGTKEIPEDDALIKHLPAVRYDLGYSHSQWTAEGMVRRMQERGLPAAIYRPGFIIGDSRTGAGNPNDFITRMIVGCIQLGSFPRVVDFRFEYSTMDFVVDACLHIASSNNNLGRSYHILSQDQTESLTMEETYHLINKTGYPVKLTDYALWVEEVRQHPDNPLAPVMPLLQERVLGQMTRWEISQYSPRYDATNTWEALADRPDIKYVPFTPKVLRRYLNFWKRKGFYDV
ncbi:hypothetical protein XA68_17630 [Ophiocordyceps unilateralis]|uniref:Carrier domain-containing protein n=1 Tax=Ophiocordyceps unilateralis TaxID=268505 RepID=A0A2A9PJ05_OPHUN|nr:hypothetical protein XA68_17630 [Ophiocordyceps unilateralis]